MDNVNKLTAISLAVAAALPMMASADVMITEYVEGSSNNKAIELYNSGDTAIDLAGYKLVRYKDGATVASDMVALDGQSIAPKTTKVILNSSAVITLAQGVDSYSGSLSFNGGDAVALVKDDAVVDIIGDVPTPTGWGLDVTLKRKLDALVANTVFNVAQWEQLPKDTFSGLGSLETPAEPEVPLFSCSGAKIVPIYQVQGAGESSPYVPEGAFESEAEVTVRGVVTARGESLFKGFYLQEVKGDNSPYTSDGVFVFLGEAVPEAIQPGVEVCVQGKVKEYFGLTQIDIKADKKFEVGAKGEVPVAAPFYVADGETLAQALERYEGMNVALDAGSDLKISRTFSYDYAGRRNNMLVSYQAPLMKSTQLYPALSAEATALVKSNLENQLFIESDYKPADGVIPYFPDFNVETGYIRVGDQLTNLQGVIGYSYGAYRLVATNTITAGDFIRGDDRTDAPSVATKGDLRVASFNVLNFFNDVDGGDTNPSGSNRGALTLEEMVLQRTKIVSAITAMNADIVGLMEIANNGFGEKSAIKNLVDALNEKQTPENAYSFVEITDADKYDGKYFGTDAITVGMLYRGGKVTLAGAAQAIDTPEQHASAGSVTRTKDGKTETNPGNDAYQRHSLAQTFKIHDESLTVVVNHLKSKGSGCLEDWANFEESVDPADQQGKCNAFRVSAAKVLGETLKDVKGDLLIIGDMNAYGMEDPIRVLTDFDASKSERDIMTASWTTLDGKVFERQGSKIEKGYGLINLNTKAHGAGTYSYSYNGELGNLDHALANASLAKRLVDIEDWHINSVESNLFEYGKKFSGDLAKSENAFSASDHDPVIVALSYPAPVVPPKPEPTPKDDGGALGYLGLALMSLFGLQRRRR
ncbi:extracellular exonuclease ExeM [Shewanella baltica]|uniref:extracellular exonuclease ExeM n=1 Tax=Shewanella baltica TaxID=62322 RepID=UPI00217E49DA|nr:extracellular exonuclease ExeM [Shewanella baltica]MCS6127818.1 extracellular exonuclease ExeM [Shewanella baltica]MCS6139891.1 extracellular exonuclease ExeM [Shewanella baltica]MCS6146032.1 extracellular exonuclease ExeM [Shewanella baltica]MCS6170562.1 extracellular exonuclease ExeM [Shewanella baltica]MCS6187893.1 extracellular exonuclease ExeM [Shewanella baltica]